MRAGGANTDYEYDDAQRIDEFTHDFTGTTYDLVTGFDFNPAGQITSLSRSNDYYHYIGSDNKIGAYVVNGLNQYSYVGGQNYSYDANGNLTSDDDNTYVYDAENRLTNMSGGANATLEYDPLGRVFQVTVNGVSRQFLYDGDALVAEYANSGNTPLVRYVHGDQTDEPWVQYSGATIGQSQRIYLHTDHQHSVIVHSDGQGNVVNTLSYDNYGIPGIENVGRFGYTGQVWLADVGLYYYKARMYSPVLGRFLQTDPIGYEDQMNLYAYVNNDPLNAVDPSGMETRVYSRALAMPGGSVGVHTFTRVRQKEKVLIMGVENIKITTTTISSHDVNGGNVVSYNHPSDTGDVKIKESVVIDPPKGMTEGEFDKAVLKQADKMVNNLPPERYEAFPDEGEPEGNCNTTTKELIEGAGGEIPKDFDPPGLNPGLH